MRRSKIMMVCWIVVAVFFGSCDRSPEAKLAKHVKRGDAYAKEEKFKEAVIEYRNAVKAVPNDPQGYILQSGLAVRAGNVDEGIAKLKKAAS